jgi:uncharacterized protein (TIGR02466 family)
VPHRAGGAGGTVGGKPGPDGQETREHKEERMSVQVDNRWHFGIPILEVTLPGFEEHREALVAYCLAQRAADPGRARSNQNGWHSQNDQYRSKDPEMAWLVKLVGEVGGGCIRQMEGPAFTGDVFMTDMWINVNEAGAWNAPHVHLPNEWAGVVYIAAEHSVEGRNDTSMDGDILFFNPMPVGHQYHRPATISYSPKNGTMFLFPGYLLHMVAPHRSPQPRISVAFNFHLKPKAAPAGA